VSKFRSAIQSQKGVAHLLAIILVVLGIGVGLFLVQSRTNWLPSAQQEIPPATAFYLHPISFYQSEEPFTSETEDQTIIDNKSPEKGRKWFFPKEKISVQLQLSSDIDFANVFNAQIKFNQELLEVTSLKLKGFKDENIGTNILNGNEATSSGSNSEDYLVKVWLEKTFDNSMGMISLVGGVSNPGIKTSPGQRPILATIVFRARKEGLAEVSFAEGSSILRSSDNSNILILKEALNLEVREKPRIAGDVDGDGNVGMADFSKLVSKLGSNDKQADLNGDGKVNMSDLSLIFSNWGKKKTN
jgi:hypothetical protein